MRKFRNHIVLTFALAMMFFATPAQAATLTVSPSPIVVLPSTVTFGPLSPPVGPGGGAWDPAGSPVKIKASPAAGPAMNLLIATCIVDALGNLTGTVAGSPCTMTATTMTADGSYALTATQTPSGGGSTIANALVSSGSGSSVPLPSPTLGLSPNPFTANDTVTLTGCAFQIFGTINVLDFYLAGSPTGSGTYPLVTGVTPSAASTAGCTSGGTFTANFTFPTNVPTGTYYVNAYLSGAGGDQGSLVEMSQAYALSWTESGATTAVLADPTYTG